MLMVPVYGALAATGVKVTLIEHKPHPFWLLRPLQVLAGPTANWALVEDKTPIVRSDSCSPLFSACLTNNK
jgi:hypothetical protein